MKILSVIALCCVFVFQVTESQRSNSDHHNAQNAEQSEVHRRQYYDVQLRQIPIKQIGPIHFHGVIGVLPPKYFPLSEEDKFASNKILNNFKYMQPFLPDTLTIPQVSVTSPGSYSQLTLTDIQVAGIKETGLKSLEVRLQNHRIDFAAIFHSISAGAEFEFIENVGTPVIVKGRVRLPVQYLQPVGAVGLRKERRNMFREVYQLFSGDVVLEVPNIQVYIDYQNATNHDLDGDFIKSKILIGKIEDLLADAILNAAIKQVNKRFESVPASLVQRYLSK
ncbi:uncharacterized protein LOC142981450 [Anticarsia gemmatalis]|uniref:uncharacterized protein LOC142981450 n=1 Tax=Anticarsia gemmatalis TaxID=129554 RepID=UPI003F757C0F